MSIFGYDDIGDMFDGGGPGKSGDTFGSGGGKEADTNKDGFVSKKESDKNPLDQNFISNISNSTGISPKGSDKSTVKGEFSDEGITAGGLIKTAILPMTALPKVFGGVAKWANGLDYDADKNRTVKGFSAGAYDGRQVYVNEDGMKYSKNFLGMPYQVEVTGGGKVVDYLSLDAKGQAPDNPNYDRSTSGYQKQQDAAAASGDSSTANQISQYEEDNANEEGDGAEERLFIEKLKQMAADAGVTQTVEDAQALIDDPEGFLASKGLKLSEIIKDIKLDPNAEGTTLDINDPRYKLGDLELEETALVEDIDTVGDIETTEASTYEAAKNEITETELAKGITGEIRDENLVDATEYITDMTGAATGVNEDGTVNELGKSLTEYASIDLSTIVDTSTVQGKLLADKYAAEGKNFVDAKTSLLWQTKTMSEEFKGPNGEPIIPSWAQAAHRDASKYISFNGISGTAAIGAMSNAIMEATIGIAEKESAFYQTLTTTNLTNQQETFINRMNILSNLEMNNVDALSAAAIQNAKSFLEIDLKNLDNLQQAEIVNTNNRVQAMFENTKAENAALRFASEERNDLTEFYARMQVTIDTHNSTQINTMRKFNAGEINDAAQYYATLKTDRQKFEAEMAEMIDRANATWRQTVETERYRAETDAATTDVTNSLDLSKEGLSRVWDSADNLLDYIYKAADSSDERELRLIIAQLQAQSGSKKSGNSWLEAALKIGGAYLGTDSGSEAITDLLGLG